MSVDMVQRAARIGAPVVAAVSAPTAPASRTVEACGGTLVAFTRGEVFTPPARVIGAQRNAAAGDNGRSGPPSLS